LFARTANEYKFCFKLGKKDTETNHTLLNVYSNKDISTKCLFERITCIRLKAGYYDVINNPRSGKPSTRNPERVENGRDVEDRDLK
jgi:hypothetical protein